MIYTLRWPNNDLQRFRTALQRFTTVYNGSHTTVKKYVISLIENVYRCELIEIYSLAHVNRKKKHRIFLKNKTYFRLSASMCPRKIFREIILANNNLCRVIIAL